MDDMALSFFIQGIIPLASIVSGAVCSIYSMCIGLSKDRELANLRNRHEIEMTELKHQHEVEIAEFKHQHEVEMAEFKHQHEVEMADKQEKKDSVASRKLRRFEFEKSMDSARFEIFVRMIPFLIEAHRGDSSHKNELLALSLELLSCAEYDTPLFRQASSFVQTLSGDSDCTNWLHVAVNLANSIYYHPDYQPDREAP